MSAINQLIRYLSELFVYRYESGLLFRVHILSKLLLIVVVLISVFMYANNLFSTTITLIALLILALATLDRRRLLKSLASLCLFIGILYAIFAIYSIVPKIVESRLVLNDILTYVLGIEKLLCITIPFTMLFMTTKAIEYAELAQSLRIPYRFLYAFTLAIRLLVLVLHDLMNIYDTQRVRGLRLDRGGIFGRARAWLHLVVPLMIVSIDRVDDLCLVMENRGFGKHNSRTFLHRKKISLMDTLLIAYSLMILILAIVTSSISINPFT